EDTALALTPGAAQGTFSPTRLEPATLVVPDQVAGGRVDGLHLVPRIGQEHDAVVDQGRTLVCTFLAHGASPHQCKLADIVAVDLVELAIAPHLVVAAHHHPVFGRRVLEIFVGHGDVVRYGAGARRVLRNGRSCGKDQGCRS